MGNIYHQWNGTVLTITSDSGTSSADLRGEKGDIGIRGAQGIRGEKGGNINSVNGKYGDVVLTYSDVGASPDTHTHTLDELGAASVGHTHTLEELGAAANNHSHTLEELGAADANHTHTLDELGAMPNTYEAPVLSVNGMTGNVSISLDNGLPTGGEEGQVLGIENNNVAWIDNAKFDVLAVYPIGSIYMSVNSVSPSNLFGGTWERLKDRFLLGAGDTYTAGNTGGSATHTLTTNEIPSHYHTFLPHEHNYKQGSGSAGVLKITTNEYGMGIETTEFTTSDVGGGKAHNNMPPYLAVYMWKRVA